MRPRQHRPHPPWLRYAVPVTSSTAPAVPVPTWAEAVRYAAGSMAADGLEIDGDGLALLERVAREELTADDAVEQVLARYR